MITEKLLEQVRGKLNVTWQDEETDNRINTIVNSAIPYLTHKLGITDATFDFSVAGMENTLFLAYCLYEWNHATNEFEDNYSQMIADVRAMYEVNHYLNKEEE